MIDIEGSEVKPKSACKTPEERDLISGEEDSEAINMGFIADEILPDTLLKCFLYLLS